MERAPRNGIKPLRPAGGPRDTRHRSAVKWKPACDALDNRVLLSTVTSATAEFPVPSPTLVTQATTMLERLAPRVFDRLQTVMAEAEQASRIDPADVTALAEDEAVVDQDVTSASLSSYDNANDLSVVQDWVDYAFTYSTLGFRVASYLRPLSQVPERLDALLGNAPAVFQATGPDASSSAIDQMTDQIKDVAEQSQLTPAIHNALKNSYNILNNDLGRHPNILPGPGGTMRNPLIVYYDAQVNNFVR
jgi:hypothetical protein